MLQFYQKARAPHRPPQTSYSVQKEMSKDLLLLYRKRAKVLKKTRAKDNLTMVRMHAQQINLLEEEDQPLGEMKLRLFNNSAIKQKMKDVEMQKAEERVRKRMRKETIELAKCEHSVHQYLIRKIQQNIQNAQHQKHTLQRTSMQRGQIKRYKTLNQQETSRKSLQFACMITESISNKGERMKSSLLRNSRRQSRESSNLISQDESLLAHIAKRQKQYQQKSLKIVTVRNRSSMHQPSQMPITVSTERWHCNRTQTRHLKSHPTRKCAVQCIIASKPPKQSTENLIKPWDAECKYQ